MVNTRNNQNSILSQEISRRKLIKLGLITAVSSIIPGNALGAVSKFLCEERTICVYNLHSKEYADITYWKDGGYDKDALKELNYIFRDHYNGTVRRMDPRLFDFLYSIQQKLQCKEPFHLISGYRSPATNRKLRKWNKGVARRSLHIKGQAADIRIPEYKIKEVRQAAYELHGGGVGYYPRSKFVHVDVGRVRFWRG